MGEKVTRVNVPATATFSCRKDVVPGYSAGAWTMAKGFSVAVSKEYPFEAAIDMYLAAGKLADTIKGCPNIKLIDVKLVAPKGAEQPASPAKLETPKGSKPTWIDGHR